MWRHSIPQILCQAGLRHSCLSFFELEALLDSCHLLMADSAWMSSFRPLAVKMLPLEPYNILWGQKASEPEFSQTLNPSRSSADLRSQKLTHLRSLDMYTPDRTVFRHPTAHWELFVKRWCGLHGHARCTGTKRSVHPLQASITDIVVPKSREEVVSATSNLPALLFPKHSKTVLKIMAGKQCLLDMR